MSHNFYHSYGKRLFDVTLSSVGLIILSPVILVIALSIKLTSKGPIIFKQERMGKGFKPFQFFKFRSMVPNASSLGPGITSKGDPRITPIGKWLRATKCDELPQLLNVIKGDMSLVGPRPELDQYVQKARKDYTHILTIKPGITDMAAIVFRDEESKLATYSDKETVYVNTILPQKIQLYRQYMNTMSLRQDLKILFRTFTAILNPQA
ncbi:MAG: sugar transferase [Candidatus Margulisbacteria bacterium]|nr:sugar transferase [Candidatus Margulisiibacteriota bacterium]